MALNGVSESAPAGLNVLIIGAGIGGLACAIGLRRQGHTVRVFESSKFSKETGAAVHIAPNANGVLKRLGINVDEIGANLMLKYTEYDLTGDLIKSVDLREANKLWQHDWRLAHRVGLHEALKTEATRSTGEGVPVELNLDHGVADVDPEQATITLTTGAVVRGDIVVGADGVRSVARSKIPGGNVSVHGSGKSAFRFLIKRSTLLEDPQTKKYVENQGELIIWFDTDRRVVMYPTSNDCLMNFVCIHPDSESYANENWHTPSDVATLLRVYDKFDPGCKAVLEKADSSSVHVWKLLDMPVLPTWINSRLALLGDAAHPFLPHQGQGAACAIEDAVSLATILEKGILAEEVPARLKLYEQCRYERANKIQQYSRLAGADLDSKASKLDIIEYTNYNFGHDEIDYSAQKLREWKWSLVPKIYWRMPVAFGPMPGPRQSHSGRAREATESTFVTASIKFKTSRTILQNLFPPGTQKFRFKSPGSIAYCSFNCTTLDKMEWLGGTGYSHIGLYIHGVEYHKDDGGLLNGTYLPILFESLTDPIVSGREELGMPKLYSSIDIFRGSDSYRVSTGWQGSVWGNFQLQGLKLAPEELENASGQVSGEADDGMLAYRYMPQVGSSTKGEAESEYATFVPFKEEKPLPVPRAIYKASSASFHINALDWAALPTLHHVISRLQEIPVYEIVSAKVVEGTGVPDVAAARKAEFV